MEDSKAFLFVLSENQLTDKLQKFRADKQYIDLMLQVGHESFDAHKIVLRNFSPVVDKQFADNWNFPDRVHKIVLDELVVDPSIVDEILNFAYTGKFMFTADNARIACIASHHLQVSSLLSACEEYLSKFISQDNVASLYKLSLQCDLGILNLECLKFLANNHTLLYERKEYLHFECNDLVQLFVELHATSPGNTDLKESVFYCINLWIHEDLKIRQFFLAKLLNAIPLDELRFRFLSEQVAIHSAVRRSDYCSQLLIDALLKTAKEDPEFNKKKSSGPSTGGTLKAKQNSKSEKRHVKFSPAQNTKHIQNLYVFAGTGKGPETVIALSNLNSNSEKWKTIKKQFTKREILGAAMIDKKIFVAGKPLENEAKSAMNLWGACGQAQKDNAEDVMNGRMPFEEYDLEKNEWKVQEYVPIMRYGFGMCSLNGQIYIAGGKDKNDFELSTVTRYDPTKCEWTFVSSMNQKRSNFRLVELNRHLYAIGGERMSCAERYDPEEDKWEMISSMNHWQSPGFSATAHNRKLYVFGVKGFEVYTPESDTWFTMPMLAQICDGNNLVSFNDHLLALGGKNPDSLNGTQLVYQFDTLVRKWKQLSDMDCARKYHFSVVVNDS